MANVTITVRAFIPWASLKGYKGDDRGFSIANSGSRNASARMHLTFDLDTATGVVTPSASSSGALSWCQTTDGYNFYSGRNAKGVAVPKVDLSVNKIGNTTVVTANLAAANPNIPLSPDIDVVLQMRITENGHTLDVHTELGGDLFPAAEVLISDGQENVWLAGFSPSSPSDISKLFGSGEDLSTDQVSSKVQILRKGTSFALLSGTLSAVGEAADLGIPTVSTPGLVTIDQWNKNTISAIPQPNVAPLHPDDLFEGKTTGPAEAQPIGIDTPSADAMNALIDALGDNGIDPGLLIDNSPLDPLQEIQMDNSNPMDGLPAADITGDDTPDIGSTN